MKTSEKLYNLNANLSIQVAQGMGLDKVDLETLNLKLGEIIKEIRELEGEE